MICIHCGTKLYGKVRTGRYTDELGGNYCSANEDTHLHEIEEPF